MVLGHMLFLQTFVHKLTSVLVGITGITNNFVTVSFHFDLSSAALCEVPRNFRIMKYVGPQNGCLHRCPHICFYQKCLPFTKTTVQTLF